MKKWNFFWFEAALHFVHHVIFETCVRFSTTNFILQVGQLVLREVK